MKSQKSLAVTKSSYWGLIYLPMLLVLLAALLLQMGNALAKPVGTVINSTGPLLAKKSDGLVRVLAINSTVEQGDTLESQKDSYARIRFLDNTELMISPNTQLKIDKYAFNEAKPANDASVFTLIKGGLRSITGSIGKRNKERYQLNTPAATIGIRGTTYVVRYIQPNSNAENCPSGSDQDDCPELKPGLYLYVIEGGISAKNDGGTQNYEPGQNGYAASFDGKPILLTSNPGINFEWPVGRLGDFECSK